MRDVAAVDANRAPQDGPHADQRARETGFAGGAGANHADNFPGGEVKFIPFRMIVCGLLGAPAIRSLTATAPLGRGSDIFAKPSPRR